MFHLATRLLIKINNTLLNAKNSFQLFNQIERNSFVWFSINTTRHFNIFGNFLNFLHQRLPISCLRDLNILSVKVTEPITPNFVPLDIWISLRVKSSLKGSIINYATQFWTIFDFLPPPPLRNAFSLDSKAIPLLTLCF